jgi:chemotaxis family two-component system response regulator Rcp1
MPADPLVVHAIDILVVEDSASDLRLTREALRRSKLVNRLMVAPDGVEALAILRQQGRYANNRRPDLILLDLKLPRKSGRDVLAEIKEDPELKRIPVVIVSSSTAEEDIVRSYDLHANCYIAKPLELENFVNVVKAIEDFWVGIVKLPPK